MPRNLPSKHKLTDAERHERFVETAKLVEASNDPKDFETAFSNVTRRPPKKEKALER
jgi:hypothetical protein